MKNQPKNDLTAHISVKMELDNVEMKDKMMEQFYLFMGSLNRLQVSDISINLKVEERATNDDQTKEAIPTESANEKKEIDVVEESEEKQLTVVSSLATETEATEPAKMYRFERRMNGGELPEIKAFVPYRTILELGLVHGDKLYAIPMENAETYSGPKRYHYELAERGDGIPPKGLKEFHKCKVEKMRDIDKLYVERTLNDEPICKKDGMTHQLFINERDIQDFGFRSGRFNYEANEGPIVDLIYNESDPQGTLRVQWSHTTEEMDERLTPKIGGFAKKNKKNEKEDENVEQNFQGVRVLVIGCEPKKSIYRDMIEKRGGDFDWASGREGERLKTMVRKADMVIMNTKHVSHNGTWSGVDYCKDYDVPFDTIDTFGNTSFLAIAEDLLEAIEQKRLVKNHIG